MPVSHFTLSPPYDIYQLLYTYYLGIFPFGAWMIMAALAFLVLSKPGVRPLGLGWGLAIMGLPLIGAMAALIHLGPAAQKPKFIAMSVVVLALIGGIAVPLAVMVSGPIGPIGL